MLDNQKVRSAAAAVVEPVAKFLLRLGLTANHLTVITSMVSSLVAIWFWSRGEFAFGLLLGIPFVLGDLLDGTMARLSNSVSRFGGFLDSVMDRVTDASLLGALAFWAASGGRTWGLAGALVSMGMGAVVPYARAKAESLGVSAKTGLMERSDRLVTLLIGAIAAALGFTSVLEGLLIFLAIATSFTVVQRVQAVRRGLANEGQ